MDKTYTFKHWQTMECDPSTATLEELEAKLIEDCLSKGYVPSRVETNQVYYSDGYTHLAASACAYTGKKKAREIWAERSKWLNKEACVVVS